MTESATVSGDCRSPFDIPSDDIKALCNEEGFQVLRSYLARHADFCAEHATCDEQAKQTWLLHRDILHALVMPVVELFTRASALAEAALCTHKCEDLELAFAGEARGAFLCLQCFITEEEDWCRTRGCPACVTSATLSTESHIRLTIAASLLSTASVTSPSSSTTSTPINSPTSEVPASGLALPPLPHILPALREALASDPFWGPSHWSYLLSRATQLSAGIQALITDCVNLESLVSSPVSERQRLSFKRSVTTPGVQFLAGGETPEQKGVKLRKSQLAKRQLRMKGEEVELLRRAAMQCWAKAVIPASIREEVLGSNADGGDKRVRSLTCP